MDTLSTKCVFFLLRKYKKSSQIRTRGAVQYISPKKYQIYVFVLYKLVTSHTNYICSCDVIVFIDTAIVMPFHILCFGKCRCRKTLVDTNTETLVEEPLLTLRKWVRIHVLFCFCFVSFVYLLVCLYFYMDLRLCCIFRFTCHWMMIRNNDFIHFFLSWETSFQYRQFTKLWFVVFITSKQIIILHICHSTNKLATQNHKNHDLIKLRNI